MIHLSFPHEKLRLFDMSLNTLQFLPPDFLALTKFKCLIKDEHTGLNVKSQIIIEEVNLCVYITYAPSYIHQWLVHNQSDVQKQWQGKNEPAFM